MYKYIGKLYSSIEEIEDLIRKDIDCLFPKKDKDINQEFEKLKAPSIRPLQEKLENIIKIKNEEKAVIKKRLEEEIEAVDKKYENDMYKINDQIDNTLLMLKKEFKEKIEKEKEKFTKESLEEQMKSVIKVNYTIVGFQHEDFRFYRKEKYRIEFKHKESSLRIYYKYIENGNNIILNSYPIEIGNTVHFDYVIVGFNPEMNVLIILNKYNKLLLLNTFWRYQRNVRFNEAGRLKAIKEAIYVDEKAKLICTKELLKRI